MKTILLTISLFSLCMRPLLAQQTFSREAMLEDFRYMKKALLQCHPGLYRYQTSAQIDSLFHATEAAIGDSLSLYEGFALFSRLTSAIRCAHTVLTPQENWTELFFREVRHFPYQVFFIGDKAYLTVNRTRDKTIKPGAELLSINGMTADSIRQRLFRHLSADGYNQTLKAWQIDNLMFSYYYHLLIGRPDTFLIQYRDLDGAVREHRSPALGTREVDQNTHKNPVNRAILRHYPRKKPQRFEIDPARGIAVLTLREFFGGDGASARRQLREYLGKCMQQISEQKIGHLVVDLRNNSGGYDSQGQELLSWFIARPVPYYRRLHTVTRDSEFLQYSTVPKATLAQLDNILTPESDGTFTINAAADAGLQKIQPAPGAFSGKVYFLVNGATGSATAEFTAVAKANGIGIFIGEETGGGYEGGNGSEFVGIKLPQTKMKLSVPLVYYHMAVGTPALPGRGTMPDHEVNYTLEDVMTGRDPYLECVYRLVRERESAGN